jgi:hypothetical protein
MRGTLSVCRRTVNVDAAVSRVDEQPLRLTTGVYGRVTLYRDLMRVPPPADLEWPDGEPPSLFHTVCIRIDGGSFEPSAVTALLGVEPTEDVAALVTPNGTAVGSWWDLQIGSSIDAGPLLAGACGILEPHARALRDVLEPVGASIRVCVTQHQAISLGNYGAGYPEVAMFGAAFEPLPPEILSRLARAGASLWMLASPWVDEILDD